MKELHPSLLRITGDYFTLRQSLFKNFAVYFSFHESLQPRQIFSQILRLQSENSLTSVHSFVTRDELFLIHRTHFISLVKCNSLPKQHKDIWQGGHDNKETEDVRRAIAMLRMCKASSGVFNFPNICLIISPMWRELFSSVQGRRKVIYKCI